MIHFRTPTDTEFQQICKYIKEYELDDRALQAEEFTAAFNGKGTLCGFGRLREHEDCTELCSLGVVTDFRNQGIGKMLVKELISRATKKLYLVSVIPDFFRPCGFRLVDQYPAAIRDKSNYCTQHLVVPESYVAMLQE